MTRSYVTRPLILLMAVAAVSACGGDDGPAGLDPNLYQLSAVSGGGASGLAGTVIDEPLVAEVTRKDTGAPETGVSVTWRVISGSGEPTRSRSVTDGNGEASTRVELGTTTGSVTVQASVPGLPSVTFPALTVLPAPSIASLSVSSADPGDTIEVRVNNLPTGVTADVLFDGVAGEVVDQTPGAPTLLDVVVPAPVGVCSLDDVAVDVRLRADGVTTAARVLNVSVPAEPFQVGQVLVIEGTTDVQCALLPADGGNAKYLLVALSPVVEGDSSFQVTLGAGNVSLTAADAAPAPLATTFHDGLRAIEARLAAAGIPAAQPPRSGPALFAAPSVGDTRSFWIVSNLEGVNEGQIIEENFDRINATLRFIGGNTLLYIDNDAPSAGLTTGDIEAIGELYDQRLYEVDVDYYGEPTDVDGNDKVIVLLSPVVNSLTPRDANGVVVGFFFGLDLFPPNASGCFECRFSNGSELFYGLVPDEGGIHSDPRTREWVLEKLPGVMIHETQHMIDFRYKVFETPLVPATEILWLSEALAHMAEEKGGDILFEHGDIDLANDLYSSNFSRLATYLAAPDSFSLSATEGGGSLGERGGWWMMLRWIAEQYGDFILRDLTQEPERGVANMELRTGESFFRLYADFAVAAWADDLDIPGLAQRYQIPKWDMRSILQVNPGPVYALQPLEMTFTLFRGSPVIKDLAASSPLYVLLTASGDTNALQLQLTATTDAGMAILRYE
ncbi:MAG TPA: Ig-like domain-containing protein [Gemmatimonadota bacterium]|nr:Ig-like domain-containing protein [Gemmatimonadota bacterium]